MNRTSIALLIVALSVTLTMGTAEAGKASRLLNNGAANKAASRAFPSGGNWFRSRRTRRHGVVRKPDVILFDEPISSGGLCPNPQDYYPGC